jgi:hypothetical protein
MDPAPPVPPREGAPWAAAAIVGLLLGVALLAVLVGLGWSDSDDAMPSDRLVPGGVATGGAATGGAVAGPDAPGAGTPITWDDEPRVPDDARAWRFTYRTSGVDGRPVVATALLVVPAGGSPGGDRPLVVWGHPTRGLADTCAPSLDGPEAIPRLDALLDEGWAVLAPDYEGLGGDGLHPYLVGTSEGRSTLDAVRSVQSPGAPDSGVTNGSPIAFYGFSQGGHAMGFAAELAGDSSIDLRGVAVVNPVSDTLAFARRFEREPDQFGGLVAMTAALARVEPEVSLDDLLGFPGARRAVVILESACIGEVMAAWPGTADRHTPVRLDDLPVLVAALERQRLGGRALPDGIPAFVAQGNDDTTIDPADTAALVDRWCAGGAPVRFRQVPGAGHDLDLGDEVVIWLRDRFGAPGSADPDAALPPDDCPIRR